MSKTTTPRPRVTFLCPLCNQLIARLYTAAQIDGAAWPVLRHRGITREEGSRITGEDGPFSINTNGLRDKERQLQDSYIADIPGLTADGIAVACRCGKKFSVPTTALLQALTVRESNPRVLPTSGL